ncbi:MAG: translation initiation factor IF-2 [Alphaproteobacteria bacterium]|nr:translation initiation factor IF-2 [Alphaproteobacteria bacterium]
MTDEKKPLTLSGKTLGLNKGTLSLNTPVRSAGGRHGAVQVEVRKKRVVAPDVKPAILTEGAEQKLKLLQEAQKHAEHARQLELERQAKAEAEAERIAQQRRKQAELEAKQAAESPAGAAPQRKDAESAGAHDARKAGKAREPEERAAKKGFGDKGPKFNASSFRNVSVGGEEDEEGVGSRRRSLASIRRAREKERLKHLSSLQAQEKITREITIPETISVAELANRMSEKGATVVKELMKLGMMVTITQTIDADTAELVAAELGHKVRRVSESDVEDVLKTAGDDPADLTPRPPVVTVMGHVDHGKTSLLDALRQTHIAEGEAGGITQHIGAYQIEVGGKKVTFIDTPGHEAFTEMRSRGAKVTDVVVLVVAANDSVMPQTIEAIHHAKAAGVPIVVAINKMDAPGANPHKVRTDLLSHEVVVESMGGDVMDVEVSAKQRMNLDKLVEAILLQAEVLDLKAARDRPAEAVVIEAKMDKGRGSVATALIQKGTLRIGDIFVTGQEWGRVRSLFNDKGQIVDEAVPAQPVEVIGLQGTPKAGDDFIVVSDEAKAREVSAYRARKARELLNVKKIGGTEGLLAQIAAGEIKELPVVVKADVQGSVEALNGILSKIANNEVKVRILHSAVGAINESDVTLARASHAIVVGFNVRANATAREQAKRDGVDIRYYSIIYDVADDMKKAVEGLLAPELREKVLGHAEIRQVFTISRVGKIAGCMVTEGLVKRGAKVRLLRDNVVIWTGDLSQLKRMKDDVKEVKSGFDCGMSFENYNDIKEGDRIECFEIESIAGKLIL